MFNSCVTTKNFLLFKCISFVSKNQGMEVEELVQNTNLKQTMNQNSYTIKEDFFEYEDILLHDLALQKMPYVNRNRSIFSNPDIDLIDVFTNKNIVELDNLLLNISNTRLKLNYLLKYISNMPNINYFFISKLIKADDESFS